MSEKIRFIAAKGFSSTCIAISRFLGIGFFSSFYLARLDGIWRGKVGWELRDGDDNIGPRVPMREAIYQTVIILTSLEMKK